MSIPRALFKASVALALAPFAFFTASASAQSPPPPPDSTVVVAETPEATTDSERVPFRPLRRNAETRRPLSRWNRDLGDSRWCERAFPAELQHQHPTPIPQYTVVRRRVTPTTWASFARFIRRNDITVNRAMFILGGYIFDKRLRYSFTVWTSAGAASIVVASNIGWRFNQGTDRHREGTPGVPGSRSS